MPNSIYPKGLPGGLCQGGVLRRSLGEGGITLVEILIALGLLVIVLALLFVPLSSSLSYFRSATARTDAQTVARTALDAMARELSEAMYVQLDMYDSSMIAFVPPLRVNPDDPNSEIVTPPRPDYSRAIRYWQALNDPTRNYNPGAYLEPSNMFFVARTMVPDPFEVVKDGWNRWNDSWAREQKTDLAGFMLPYSEWAPIPRAVHADVDWRGRNIYGMDVVGRRNKTLQPGYPYLHVIHSYADPLPIEGVREYRKAVVALTPNAPEYDVSQLSFEPTVIAGERLRAIEGPAGPDGSVYRARYPLWRQGAPYTGWSALAGNPQLIEVMRNHGMHQWARDPFLLISRYIAGGMPESSSYQLSALAAFDPRTRTMKVLDIAKGLIYDTGAPIDRRMMPNPSDRVYDRGVPTFGFTADYIDGSLRFDFPRQQWIPDPNPNIDDKLELKSAPDGQWDFPLSKYWRDYYPGSALSVFFVPDSVSVRLSRVVKNPDGTGTGRYVPDRALRQVYCAPREGTDEFQLGLEPNPDASEPPYGWIRLPANLADGQPTNAPNDRLVIDYRWRSDGVVPPSLGGDIKTMKDEKPDLVTAYYRTDAIIDISLTVSRADPSAPVGKRIAQSSYLTRVVKLHNVLREIRYGENQ